MRGGTETGRASRRRRGITRPPAAARLVTGAVVVAALSCAIAPTIGATGGPPRGQARAPEGAVVLEVVATHGGEAVDADDITAIDLGGERPGLLELARVRGWATPRGGPPADGVIRFRAGAGWRVGVAAFSPEHGHAERSFRLGDEPIQRIELRLPGEAATAVVRTPRRSLATAAAYERHSIPHLEVEAGLRPR